MAILRFGQGNTAMVSIAGNVSSAWRLVVRVLRPALSGLRRFGGRGVVLRGQQPDSPVKGEHARQVKARLLGDLGAFKLQGGCDVTVPGVYGDQPSGADSRHQGAHGKGDRQV